MASDENRVPVKCACHGSETMATIVDGNKVVITDRRHGQTHTAVVNLTNPAKGTESKPPPQPVHTLKPEYVYKGNNNGNT